VLPYRERVRRSLESEILAGPLVAIAVVWMALQTEVAGGFQTELT
jgi:hypothetical protein